MRPERLAARRPRLQVSLSISASFLSPVMRFPSSDVVHVTGSAGAPETHGFEGAALCAESGSPISGDHHHLCFARLPPSPMIRPRRWRSGQSPRRGPHWCRSSVIPWCTGAAGQMGAAPIWILALRRFQPATSHPDPRYATPLPPSELLKKSEAQTLSLSESCLLGPHTPSTH
jgi:hypothetical protein